MYISYRKHNYGVDFYKKFRPIIPENVDIFLKVREILDTIPDGLPFIKLTYEDYKYYDNYIDPSPHIFMDTDGYIIVPTGYNTREKIANTEVQKRNMESCTKTYITNISLLQWISVSQFEAIVPGCSITEKQKRILMEYFYPIKPRVVIFSKEVIRKKSEYIIEETRDYYCHEYCDSKLNEYGLCLLKYDIHGLVATNNIDDIDLIGVDEI